MAKPNLKAPSFSDEAQLKKQAEDRVSDKNKLNTIILLLVGMIVCLLLIIVSLLLTPSPFPSPAPVDTIVQQKKEKIKTAVKKPTKEIEINTQIEKEQIQKKNSKSEEVKIKLKDNDESQEHEKKLKIKKEMLDKNFNNRISNALSAIEKNKLRLAEKELQNAKVLKPNEPIIEELQNTINGQIKTQTINNLTKKAQIEEKKEQWKDSLNYYEKILTIDADINKILVKKQRAINYIKINKILDNIINRSERLQNDKVLENAKNSLQIVKLEMKEKETLLYPLKQTPLLTTKIKSTEKIIKDASILITVTIRSDNLTDVIIYKIGKFGKLIEKKINLRPGNYTIVGSREGYRDIRKNIRISASDYYKEIIVECRETI